MKSVCGVALAMVLALPAWVAQAATWTQEPRAVFGVAIGEPLDPNVVPACPPWNYARGLPPKPASLCLGEEGFALRGTPDLGFESWTLLTRYRDKVMQIAIGYKNQDFDQAKAVLVTKYGPPMSEKTTDWLNQAGAKFPNRTLTWTGGKTVIVMIERNARVDLGEIAFIDLALFAEMSRDKEEAAKKAAGAL